MRQRGTHVECVWPNASLVPPPSHTHATHNAIAQLKTIAQEGLLARFRGIARPIERYLMLRDLQQARPKQYYTMLLQHTEEILPYIYTVSFYF